MPGARVLIVDSDPAARAALEAILRHGGMEPSGVARMEAALTTAEMWPPELLVTETVLPDGAGVELVRQLKARALHARMAVIGVSAQREPQLLVRAFQAGMDDFIFKPMAGEELLIRAELALKRRRESSLLAAPALQRCELTSLFCDVRGFTAVAATLDPEWVVEVLNALFEPLVAHVLGRGGRVDKFLGDGMFALFGLGGAEDKELHAIEAALAMVQSCQEYARDNLVLDGRPLGMGVGIATGEVVVAPVGASMQRQVTAIGDSVNLASRIQGVAAVGEVLICQNTHARVQRAVLADRGRSVELKGVAGRPTLYPVLGLRPEAWLAPRAS